MIKGGNRWAAAHKLLSVMIEAFEDAYFHTPEVLLLLPTTSEPDYMNLVLFF